MSIEPSFRDHLRARRDEHQAKLETQLTIPIPGYEDVLAGRHRILNFEEKHQIARAHIELVEDGYEKVAASSDIIIQSCVDLLMRSGTDENGKPVYESLDKTWNSDAVVDLFGGDRQSTARLALGSVLDSTQIMSYYGAIITATDEILASVRETVSGEAEPSVEG